MPKMSKPLTPSNTHCLRLIRVVPQDLSPHLILGTDQKIGSSGGVRYFVSIYLRLQGLQQAFRLFRAYFGLSLEQVLQCGAMTTMSNTVHKRDHRDYIKARICFQTFSASYYSSKLSSSILQNGFFTTGRVLYSRNQA
jgi:hypothetical protein